jgi:hypothetical protein
MPLASSSSKVITPSTEPAHTAPGGVGEVFAQALVDTDAPAVNSCSNTCLSRPAQPPQPVQALVLT